MLGMGQAFHLKPNRKVCPGMIRRNGAHFPKPTPSEKRIPLFSQNWDARASTGKRREAAEMLLALLDGSSEPGEQRILECKLNWLGSTSI